MIELKLKFDTVVEMQDFLLKTGNAEIEAPAPKKKAAKKKAEPAPVAELVPTAPIAVPTPTTAPADVPALPTAPAVDLRGPIAERLKAAADAGHRDAIIALLGEFGQQRFSEVSDADLPAFDQRLTAVVGA